MSEYVAHTETDEETGVTLEIVGDSDLQQPYDDDEAVKIVVLHSRYINPAKDDGLTDPELVAEFEEANAAPDAEWFTIPLFMYDHSGTVYRVGQSNPFSCQWDSGRVGIIALKRSEWGGGHESDDKLTEYAQGVAKSYSDWANGNGYGYRIMDADGDELTATWGYLGDYDDEGGALESARPEFTAYVERARKAKAEATAEALETERPDLYPA